MTPERAKQFLPLMTAFADGKTIQFDNGVRWLERDEYMFTSSLEYYRIKPEPQRVYVNIHHDGNMYPYADKSLAKTNGLHTSINERAVPFVREIPEDSDC